MGATAALPYVRYMDLAYGVCAFPLMHHPMMMWVDDTITILAKGEDWPIQGALVDHGLAHLFLEATTGRFAGQEGPAWLNLRPCAHAVPCPGCSGSACGVHLGCGHPRGQGASATRLHGAPAVPSPSVRGYRRTFFLQGKPSAPRNISAVRAEICGQMKPQRLAPDAAMMVLEAKVIPKLFATASVYRPKATIRQANDALLAQC